jgi:hypothetical protein
MKPWLHRRIDKEGEQTEVMHDAPKVAGLPVFRGNRDGSARPGRSSLVER